MRIVRVPEDVLARILRRIEELEDLTLELMLASQEATEADENRESWRPEPPRLRIV